MKLRSVKVYQYVVFNQKNHTFFTNGPAAKSLGMENVDIEYLPKINAVRIKAPGKDDILVFTTNIAYAIPMDAITDATADVNRAQIKENDPGRAVK